MKKQLRHILISRTDAIGDVLLSLPLVSVLKEHFPEATIGFLAKAYTIPVLDAFPLLDYTQERQQFLEGKLPNGLPDAIIHVFPDQQVAKKAKKLGIHLRIGTSHRWYHLLTCNHLVSFSRKKSPYHESQLSLYLLKGLGIRSWKTMEELGASARLIPKEFPQKERLPKNVDGKFHLVLHPLSRGSALDWRLENYLEVMRQLQISGKYFISITGTEKEGEIIREQCPELIQEANANLIGQLDLGELVGFLSMVDGVLACSTGPLHIASQLGKRTLGLFPDLKPMHPGRWQPIGPQSQVIVGKVLHFDKQKQNYLDSISPQEVIKTLASWSTSTI